MLWWHRIIHVVTRIEYVRVTDWHCLSCDKRWKTWNR